MGTQFTVLDSQLAKPMGGFRLVADLLSLRYCRTYSNIIAIAQIIATVLLCFRRTSLIGALRIRSVRSWLQDRRVLFFGRQHETRQHARGASEHVVSIKGENVHLRFVRSPGGEIKIPLTEPYQPSPSPDIHAAPRQNIGFTADLYGSVAHKYV